MPLMQLIEARAATVMRAIRYAADVSLLILRLLRHAGYCCCRHADAIFDAPCLRRFMRHYDAYLFYLLMPLIYATISLAA